MALVRLPARKTSGFTLLEILVALAIFALAASVLMVTDGRSIRQTAYVLDKVQASWLADRALNNYYIEEQFPDVGRHSSTVEMSGKQWFLRDQVFATSQDGLRRVEISVFSGAERPADKSVPAFRLTGYIRRPPE